MGVLKAVGKGYFSQFVRSVDQRLGNIGTHFTGEGGGEDARTRKAPHLLGDYLFESVALTANQTEVLIDTEVAVLQSILAACVDDGYVITLPDEMPDGFRMLSCVRPSPTMITSWYCFVVSNRSS